MLWENVSYPIESKPVSETGENSFEKDQCVKVTLLTEENRFTFSVDYWLVMMFTCGTSSVIPLKYYVVILGQIYVLEYL